MLFGNVKPLIESLACSLLSIVLADVVVGLSISRRDKVLTNSGDREHEYNWGESTNCSRFRVAIGS